MYNNLCSQVTSAIHWPGGNSLTHFVEEIGARLAAACLVFAVFLESIRKLRQTQQGKHGAF